MKSLSGLNTRKLAHTTYPEIDIVYWINFYYIKNQRLMDGTSMMAKLLVIMIKLLNRIRIRLHRMFATFHLYIDEYSNESYNMICRI